MDVVIDRLGARGDGIADTNDGPVYVPDALPGETIRIDSVPPRTRRRVRMAFRSVGAGCVLGFREAQSDRIVDLADCAVASPGIVAILPALRAFLPRFGKQGEVAITETEAGLDVVVFARDEPDLDLRMDAPDFCTGAGIVRLCWSAGDHAPEPILAVDDAVVRFDGNAVSIPPDCFLQPTAAGEAALQSFVKDAVADATVVADLYAGCGAFSLPVAAMGKSVHAVEAVAAQTAAIQVAGGHRGVTVETRDLVRQPLRAQDLARFDSVILDPPRAADRLRFLQSRDLRPRRAGADRGGVRHRSGAAVRSVPVVAPH